MSSHSNILPNLAAWLALSLVVGATMAASPLAAGHRNLSSGPSASQLDSSIYEIEQGSGPWGEVAKLLPAEVTPLALFGLPVSISGVTIAVGATKENSESGATYVYERDEGGPDNWGLVKKILPSDGAIGDSFGVASISGGTIAVGAFLHDDNGDGSGSAYVFERNAGGPDNWGQVKKILPSDGAAGDSFGHPVSISGDTIVGGAYSNGLQSGSAYIFERDAGGPDNWGQVKKILPSDGAADDRFGGSVSISSDTIVVGANSHDDNGLR